METLDDVLSIDVRTKFGDPIVRKALGCLFGGAAGNATADSLRLAPQEAIRARVEDTYGPYSNVGRLNDCTHLALFTAEGLLRAQVRYCTKGIGPIYPAVVSHAYLRWLKSSMGYGAHPDVHCDGWLCKVKGLPKRGAVDKTCVRSLKGLYERWSGVTGNNQAVPMLSRSSGALMRASPLAIYAHCDMEQEQKVGVLFKTACDLAQITHSHPDGYFPAAFLVVLLAFLLKDIPLPVAVDRSLEIVELDRNARGTTVPVRQALEMAAHGKVAPEDAIRRLGAGYYAPEALALAIAYSLSSDSFDDAIVQSLLGDQGDVVAAVTGSIMGTALGIGSIDPERWLARLELRDTIRDLALDLASWPSWDFESDDVWARYPGH